MVQIHYCPPIIKRVASYFLQPFFIGVKIGSWFLEGMGLRGVPRCRCLLAEITENWQLTGSTLKSKFQLNNPSALAKKVFDSKNSPGGQVCLTARLSIK